MNALQRIQTGHVAGSIELEGRGFRLLQTKHKGSITSSSIVVTGGPHAARVAYASYRTQAAERIFDIDPIVVRPETGGDRFGKKVGLNVEALIGDPEIDARFYFETDTKPEIVRALFGEPEIRVALVEALAQFPAVVIGPPGGVVAGVREDASLSLKDDERVRALQKLAEALPTIRARPPKSPFANVAPTVLGGLFCQVGFMSATIISSSCDALVGPVVLLPILLGVATALLLSFTVLLLIFRGRANGFQPWALTSFFLAVSLGGIGVAVFNDLNWRLDAEKPNRYEAPVLAYRPYIRKKQSGLLRVKGLPPSLVSPEDSSGAQEIDHSKMPSAGCKKLELFVAPGYLGNPWVSKVRCIQG